MTSSQPGKRHCQVMQPKRDFCFCSLSKIQRNANSVLHAEIAKILNLTDPNFKLGRYRISISAASLPNFSGSASAAATTASAFSSVRPETPTKAAIRSRAWPVTASGNFPGAIPPAWRASFSTAPFTSSIVAGIVGGRKQLSHPLAHPLPGVILIAIKIEA